MGIKPGFWFWSRFTIVRSDQTSKNPSQTLGYTSQFMTSTDQSGTYIRKLHCLMFKRCPLMRQKGFCSIFKLLPAMPNPAWSVRKHLWQVAPNMKASWPLMWLKGIWIRLQYGVWMMRFSTQWADRPSSNKVEYYTFVTHWPALTLVRLQEYYSVQHVSFL